MSINKISVIGLGYIGLPTAAMFASKEKKVIGVDISKHVVDTINAGSIHIIEPELEEIVKKAVDDGFLEASTNVKPADAFLIAVPTPFLPAEGDHEPPEPDLSFIKSASKSVAKVLKTGDTVILESTSPVGTTEQMCAWLSQERPDLTFPHNHGEDSDIRIAYCPERVLPGHVVKELVHNDRIIGGITEKCSMASIEIYKIFVKGQCSITNSRTAEMAKLTENSSRDVSIAFANELSIICDKLEINVWELIKLANLHPRVNILQPGPGVGGHCIAVDPWFIISKNPNESPLIHTARKLNNGKPDWVINKVRSAVQYILDSHPSKRIDEITIACYGLTFKPNIDDLRESPAMYIAKSLYNYYPGKVISYEPNVLKISDKDVILVDNNVASKADIKIILVKHNLFKEINFESGYIIDAVGMLHE